MSAKSVALPRLLDTLTITTAATTTGTPVYIGPDAAFVTLQAILTYGSGGTTAKAFLQTSLDGGATWIDIACASFTTATATKLFTVSGVGGLAAATAPTDGTLTADTTVDGVLGEFIRTKVITTGTYAGGTTLVVSAVAKAGAGSQRGTIGQAAAAASTPVVDATDVWTSPSNVAVSVANSTTALLAAAGATIRKRNTIIRNTGDRTVYLAWGENAATTKFPLGVGESFVTKSLLAINGITASGTGTVFVTAEAAS